ncbi:MAG: bifunctional riboflavin kinase/FAD synthetase [Balneolaceae bacterium]
MSRITHLNEVVRDPSSVVTVGTFDGVHKGHKVLINKVVSIARENRARSVLVTFDPHPRSIIHPGPDGVRLLTTLRERCDTLQEMGIDEMVVVPFDRDFSLLDSETFIRKILWEKIGLKHYIIGYDHQFGRNREGSIDTVKNLSKEIGFTLHIVTEQEVGNRKVSSSLIRRALEQDGDVGLASKLLGNLYRLSGTVVHGSSRGTEIGFPTANIRPDHPDKVVPLKGVYAVLVYYKMREFKGMMNIGVRPTFNERETTLEVHIFNLNEDLYGQEIEIRFVSRVRDEINFGSREELIEQLKRDRERCFEILG